MRRRAIAVLTAAALAVSVVAFAGAGAASVADGGFRRSVDGIASADPGLARSGTDGWFKPYRFSIGTTAQGRGIYVYRVAESTGGPNVIMIGTMHGDEPAGRHIGYGLIRAVEGRLLTIKGVNLWVVPAMNPDGFADRTRQNANGVDLNRNFPYQWVPLPEPTYSGPRPSSEVETQVIETLLRHKQPRFIVSVHQPLRGVGSDVKGTHLADRLSRYLHLPISNLNCGGQCHGTMTGWYNHRFAGAAVTVEFSGSPVIGHAAVVDAKRIVYAELGRVCYPSGRCQSAP
jgi:murein peptide amidase A